MGVLELRSKVLFWSDHGFESRLISLELICNVNYFFKLYVFFCRRHSLMNRPCYNNLFQFMQHDNFRNLNRVVSTQSKHLESRVNAFWYCFPEIKRCTFYYWWNWLLFQEIRFKSSRPEVFCEKAVLRNFAKFIGKHLCQSHFLMNLQTWGLQL